MWKWIFMIAVATRTLPAAADDDAVPPPAGANLQCPVLTDESADARYSTTHEGRTIYFCCGKCRKKFIAHPESYLGHLAASTTTPHGAAAGGNAPHFVAIAGKFHPLFVHFPIALLLAGAAAELIQMLRRETGLHAATSFCVGTAALLAPLAAGLGWANAAAFHTTQVDARLLFYHRWLGTTTALLAILAFLAVRVRARGPLRVMLFLAAAAVVATGHLGGLLAYGADYFSKL